MKFKKGSVVYTYQTVGTGVFVYEARIIDKDRTATCMRAYLIELAGGIHLWASGETLFKTPVDALRGGLGYLIEQAQHNLKRWNYELERLSDNDKVAVVKLEVEEL